MGLRESVIICTKNRLKDLIQCLDSLALQTHLPQELIIVDSSDTPLQKETQFLAQFNSQRFASTQLKYTHTSPGLTRQRNIGIDQAQGDIIYFFDDDVVLEKEYLAAMDKAFRLYPEYAGGMGDITNINRNVSWKYQWFRRIFLLPREQASGNFTWSGMPTHPYGTPNFKSVEVVGGCCMAFRKKILQEQKFDETFSGYAYMEDADIARRISQKYSLFFNPNAKLQHKESPTAREHMSKVSAMFTYNYSYLFFKHFYTRNRLYFVAYCWSLLGLIVQSIISYDIQRLKGYGAGLYNFYFSKKS